MKNSRPYFELAREPYARVEFNSEKAAQALRNTIGQDAIGHKRRIERDIQFNLNKFEQFKRSGGLFKAESFFPSALRAGFSNFLTFKTEDERKAYEALQGANILLFTNFMTSGTTVREAVRYLTSIHDENTLTVFVLGVSRKDGT